ncbi:MAG: hypothetical protein ACE5FO_02865 [Parvularculaceae bacterium]
MIDWPSIKANRRSTVALVAAAIAFFLVQSLAAVHASKYGVAPHAHHGQVCVLSLAAPGGGKAVAPAAFVLFFVLSFAVFIAPPTQTAPAAKPAFRPVSRGPPSV